MNNIFICPKCGSLLSGWKPENCGQCGCAVKNEDGIYIFTEDSNYDVETEGKKYIGFDVIAPNYDSSRDRHNDSEEGKAAGKWLGPGKVVLEIGAGTGYHAIPMAKAGCKVIAGDISINMLRMLTSKMRDGLDKNLMPCKLNAYCLPLADKSIDAVFIDHVFHLLDDPEKVVKEIKRVLRPDGYFLNIHYSSKDLSNEEEKALYAEIAQKMDSYYKDAVQARGLKLLERFGWIAQQVQQENLRRLFTYCDVIESPRFEKQSDFSIQGMLSNYRNRVLVNQAEIEQDVNDEIVNEVDRKLRAEYGEDYYKCKTTCIETTSIQIFR